MSTLQWYTLDQASAWLKECVSPPVSEDGLVDLGAMGNLILHVAIPGDRAATPEPIREALKKNSAEVLRECLMSGKGMPSARELQRLSLDRLSALERADWGISLVTARYGVYELGQGDCEILQIHGEVRLKRGKPALEGDIEWIEFVDVVRVTRDMVRISGSELQRLVGGAAVPPLTAEEHANSLDKITSEPQMVFERQDALSLEIDEIVSKMRKANKRVQPRTVMAKLKEMAGDPGGTILSITEDRTGVVWQRDNGVKETLTLAALGQRLRRMEDKQDKKLTPTLR